jgi:two-component system, OmpR family, response regulator
MSQRILVVDDEPNIRLTVRMCLESDGFIVDEAADGEEALRKALAYPPSLILLDHAMPKLNGTEVIERLQEAGSKTPVIVMTAYGMTMAIRAMLLGATGFLEKPLSPETIRDAVARHILAEVPAAAEPFDHQLLWRTPSPRAEEL